jgi:hypothetical protein
MANVKNLDFVLGFADVIIDEKRAVHEFADPRSFSDQATHAGKPSQ